MKYSFRFLLACVLLSVLVHATSCKGKKEQPDSTPAVTAVTVSDVNQRLASVDSLLLIKPQDAGLLHQRALVYIEMKRYQDALKDMSVAISIDSTKADYFLTLADLAFAANRTYDSRNYLEKALALDNENKEARMRLAELYLILRQHKQSVELLSQVLADDRSNTTAWLMRGINFKENGDTTRAIGDFRSAIEANPDYYEAYMQLGIIFQLRNDPVSLGYFNNALRIRPKSEEALYGRGLWFQDHGELDKAIQDYTTILQINPGYKNAHFNLGYIHHIYLKVYQEAIAHYSRAIESDPTYAEAYYNRGLCYEFLGNLVPAAADFQSALSIRPNYPPASEGLQRVSR